MDANRSFDKQLQWALSPSKTAQSTWACQPLPRSSTTPRRNLRKNHVWGLSGRQISPLLGGNTSYLWHCLGYVGFFYLVKPFDEISVAGKTTRSMVILPNSANAIEVFLKSASLAMIWNYLVRTIFTTMRRWLHLISCPLLTGGLCY